MKRIGMSGWLLAAFAAVAGGGLALDWYESRPQFAIDEPDAVFANLKVGELHEYSYRIRNLSDRPMRIVGAEHT